MVIADDSSFVSNGNLFMKEHLSETEQFALLLKAGYLTIDHLDGGLLNLRVANLDVQSILDSSGKIGEFRKGK